MKEDVIVGSKTITGDSPWFSGHFPNDPILPGIAQLKMVLDLIAKSSPGSFSMTSLSRIKFRKIIKPDQRLDIHVTPGKKEDQYIFKITNGNDDVCSGWMFLTPHKTKQIHE
jgi:3-hydroxymyristoyl/3-hydroxydecanoyl-(acyl carrier protein) dehydratase